ncbi:bola protein [Bombardia bombarda]|uniref:Bola protein n=1 Tax=Bombardia bombarda TaxID=252184 RepID=A0AA39XC04_9PEZI|nr:bola protein [Bombardia bombarda]
MICRTCIRAARANLRTEIASSSSAYSQRPFSTTSTRPLSSLLRTQISSDTTAAAAATQDTSSATSTVPEKPDSLTDGESQVWDRLAAKFAPTQLLVQDISGGCGSMYGIEISSESFRGLGMLKQQRLVNAELADLMKEWHGVQLKTRVP